jgi:signal transduction histidine kinase
MFNDELRVAAAGALIYEKPEAAAAQGERGVMIITVPVKSALLERIATDYLLQDLICVAHDTPTTGPNLVLTASDGTALAKLVWMLPQADGGLLSRLIPTLAIALFVSFVVIGFIYRRLRRVADERQREAAALATQSALLQTTFEAVNQAIGVFDRDRRLIAFNRHYGDVYDLPPGLVRVGVELRRIAEFLVRRGDFGPGDPRQVAEDIISRSEDEGLRVFDRVRPDGTALEIRRAPMPGGGFVVTISDVTARIKNETELRLARDQAEMANRAKSSFLANIGHELRTPLNAILGFSEIITKQTLGPVGSPQYAEYANDIHESGLYLLEIINDILDLSKIEAGRMELHEQQVDLGRAITSAIRLCAGRVAAGGVTVDTEFAGRPPPLYADERAVKQMLINLLSNAVKFTPQGGQITVGCRVEADASLAVRITDTGIGIAAKDMALVMAPFGQVDSDLTRRYPGTGLGLPLVKSLIELHGGELILESEVGRGTVVTLRFPASRVLKPGAGE